MKVFKAYFPDEICTKLKYPLHLIPDTVKGEKNPAGLVYFIKNLYFISSVPKPSVIRTLI
jgi:hypothetical protein